MESLKLGNKDDINKVYKKLMKKLKITRNLIN